MSKLEHEHSGHRERMKQRFLKTGFEGMAPHEILEMMLYYCIPVKDTNPLAHRLIDEFGSLSGVLEASPEALMQINGISRHSAVLLTMMPHLLRAYRTDLMRTRVVLDTSEATKQYCIALLSGMVRECFYVISLDAKGRVINANRICEGTIDEVSVYPRIIMETILKNQGKKAVLCHNHPTGILKPSDMDIHSTTKILKVLREVDIQLIDHVIVGRDSAFSMAENAMLGYAY